MDEQFYEYEDAPEPHHWRAYGYVDTMKVATAQPKGQHVDPSRWVEYHEFDGGQLTAECLRIETPEVGDKILERHEWFYPGLSGMVQLMCQHLIM